MALARLVPGAGTSTPWRFRLASAAVTVGALAVAAASIVTTDSDDRTSLRAGAPQGNELLESSTTMTSAPPAPPTEPDPDPEPHPPGRRRIVADRNGGWELLFVDDGSRCLELVMGPWRRGSLLCGAAPAGHVVGDIEAVDTPMGRVAIAVMEPFVTAVSPMVGVGGKVGADPLDDRILYAVVLGGGSGHLADVVVEAGADAVARMILPAGTGRLARSQVTVVTDPPYGRWPGYRPAGTTGLFFGGTQVVGFYDGRDGRPCVLYRRLGGPHEGIVADGCPARDPGRPLGFSRMTPIPMDTPQPGFMLVAVSDQPVTAWRCERVTGEPCGGGFQVFPDPRGTGRVALAQWIDWATPGPHDHVVLVVIVGPEERRVTVPVAG